MYKKFLKNIIDKLVAFIALTIFSPIILVLIISLYIVNEGSPFFYQVRPGKKGKLFKIIKFKTMNDKCDQNGNLLPDAERLTRVGKFVRKTSMDELPQLINVLKGDMSLIGPRPLLEEYLPLYSKEQARRHNVKPGITGWAQVNGRNAISWVEKFKLDVEYVDGLSLMFDLKIIMKTVKKVFISEGISQEGQATMSKFKGER